MVTWRNFFRKIPRPNLMLNVAVEAAQAAAKIARSYYKKPKKIEYKQDRSPVTIADREAEIAAKAIIAKNFPDHGIIGEELGSSNSKSKYQWTIDPIDGTKSFVRGMSTWSVLVALLEEDKPILGVSLAPEINELMVAEKGRGTRLNGKRVYASKVNKINLAYLSHGNLQYFEKKGKLRGLLKLVNTINSVRGAPDPYGYHLLAQGKVDMVIEARDKIYDIAVPAILVEEAGGRFTNFDGEFSLTSDCAFATNGLLHEEALGIFNTR